MNEWMTEQKNKSLHAMKNLQVQKQILSPFWGRVSF